MRYFEQQDSKAFSDIGYQNYILQGVSRTFALTIPLLPLQLREAVGNAYLLCRIADTIEDDPGMPVEQKRYLSERLLNVIAGSESAQDFALNLRAALSTKTPVAELDLVDHTDRVVRLTHSFSANQRAAISRCVAIMAKGMVYYQENPPDKGLKNMRDLDDYCYYVAGVVGELLTQLFCDYLQGQGEPTAELETVMMPLAISFGQGLQMTNILKDIWDDSGRDVCWLPRSVFDPYGVDLSDLVAARQLPGFTEGIKELIGITHAHLRNAVEYSLLIPAREVGIRRFCLLCTSLAVLSLRKLHSQPALSAGKQVKVSKTTLYSAIRVCNTFAGSDVMVRLLFRLSTLGLPAGEIHASSPASSIDLQGKPWW
ncbi:MAG: phytoene/squalene synthase family protein [Pseudomonadales bacterium]|nr:phytoene/squalene synthase family protein [Pseudomonadales bacterium]